MADPNSNADLPPLVTRPEPPLVTRADQTRAKLPPGFIEAVGWCVLFMVVLLAALVVVAGGILMAHAVGTDDPSKFINDQLSGFSSAYQPAPGAPSVAAPTEICQAIAYGMFAAQFASLVMALLVLRYRVGRDWKRQIGVRRPAAIHVVLAALTVPGFIIVASLIQEQFIEATGMKSTSPEGSLSDLFRTVPWLVTLVAVAFGPGLVEELWCRGFLGRGLCSRYGLVGGVFLTSVLFAAMHGDVSRILVYTLMGAFLHFVYLVSRSIWVPVILHLLNNGISVLMELIPSWTEFAKTYEQDASGLRPVSELAAISLLVFAGVALWSSRTEVVRAKPPDSRDDLAVHPGISALPREVGATLAHKPPSPVATLLTLIAFGTLVAILVRTSSG